MGLGFVWRVMEMFLQLEGGDVRRTLNIWRNINLILKMGKL